MLNFYALKSAKIMALTFGLSAVCAQGLPTVAGAHEVSETNIAINALDQYKARSLVRKHLTSVGYTRPGTSLMTASVGSAEQKDGVWVVSVRIGGRLPQQDAVVLIDAQSGEVLSEGR